METAQNKTTVVSYQNRVCTDVVKPAGHTDLINAGIMGVGNVTVLCDCGGLSLLIMH